MRIVIDMQGAQTESRFRGIGRFTESLAKAIVRNQGEDKIILALNGLFPETIEPIRSMFENLMPQEDIRVWEAYGPVKEIDPSNHLRREISERLREAFLMSLNPDVVLVSSLFEGLGDDAVTSIGLLDSSIPVAVVLYDLIPLINPDDSFKHNPVYRDWYARKIASLKHAKLLLTISESSRREAMEALHWEPSEVFTILGACKEKFKFLNLSEPEKKAVRNEVGIDKPFVMYTGGADERKNLHRLIEAYANLPDELRHRFQLAFIGKIPEGNIHQLRATAAKYGLADEEVVFTGYVSDESLVQLYNSCALFVFPSLHEGLGLPLLEAMACHTPAVCSDKTSLPELLPYKEAQFDPTSVQAITSKIKQALTDKSLRDRLSTFGKTRHKEFSWDSSAKLALQALHRFDRNKMSSPSLPLYLEKTSIFSKKNLKILILKLDHMGDLLLAVPAISKLKARYPFGSIDIIVGSWNFALANELNLFENIYTLDYFKKISAESPFIQDKDIESLFEHIGEYDIAIDLRRQHETRFLLLKVKAQLRVGYETLNNLIDNKLDIKLKTYPDVPGSKTPLNMLHTSEQMIRLVDSLPNSINDYINLPDFLLATQPKMNNIALFPKAGNNVKEWPEDKFLELTERLINDDAIDNVNIYFGNIKEAASFKKITHHKLHIHCELDFPSLVQSLLANKLCIANNSFGAHIASYIGCLVIGIYGGHETVSEWAPPFGESYVIHRNASCSPCHIHNQSACLNELYCLRDIPTEFVLEKIKEAINNSSIKTAATPSKLIEEFTQSINALDLSAISDNDLVYLAEILGQNIKAEPVKKQLFVDISELINVDAKTGIQRVVRAILEQLLSNPPYGFLVKPVYAAIDQGYRYAQGFSLDFRDESTRDSTLDEPIEFFPGDIFLGLDLHPQIVSTHGSFFQHIRNHGVKVWFVIYDLLPINLPKCFPIGASERHHAWLTTVANSDGAICISKAVATELTDWMKNNAPSRQRPFKIKWFHLGADLQNSSPSRGVPPEASVILSKIKSKPTFIMVGTLEPRKQYAQALEAVEILWKQGLNVQLAIIGKQGWMVDDLANKIRNHHEFGNELFWFEKISDEFLEKVYSAATCMIAASEGEGFGLPLIEAAQWGTPIIARDIAVFREVAGEHAYYFKGLEPNSLANAIKKWMELNKEEKAPSSKNIPWITWKESADQLTEQLGLRRPPILSSM